MRKPVTSRLPARLGSGACRSVRAAQDRAKLLSRLAFAAPQSSTSLTAVLARVGQRVRARPLVSCGRAPIVQPSLEKLTRLVRSGFATFCTNTLPSVAQSGLTSTVGASSTSSGSAAQSSAASSASRAVSALSSSASSIFSAASSAASSAQSSTPSGTNPTSGASKRIATAGTVAIASLASIMLMS